MMDWELLLVFFLIDAWNQTPDFLFIEKKSFGNPWGPPAFTQLPHRINYSFVLDLCCAKPHGVKAIMAIKNLIKLCCCDSVQTKDLLCVWISTRIDAVIRNYGQFANESVQTTLLSESNKRVDSWVERIQNLDTEPLFIFHLYVVSLGLQTVCVYGHLYNTFESTNLQHGTECRFTAIN